ncbi:MAG TPA: glycosyl hydrolase family 28-related protein [Gemmatimonadaceae bacterium]|nr:glycosyl hydrolase family 28-related protein [Gemmatimonadaceae bacterium]
MTRPSISSRNDYTGAGSTGPYAFTFPVQQVSDLRVVKRTAAIETVLTYPADFSTTTVFPAAAGSVTLTTALAIGDTLTIRRVPAATQPTDLRNQGGFFPATYEDALDHIVDLIQDIYDRMGRAPQAQETYPPSSLILPLIGEVGKALVWASATRLTNATIDTTGITLPGQGRTTTTTSAYLATNAVFNVLNYGAVADGVTDDRNAIVAAIAAANTNGFGVVWIPAGTYVVGSAIPLLNRVHIRGDGWNNTILKRGLGGNAVFTISGANDQYIEGIRFNGNGVAGAFIQYTDANGLYSGSRDLWFTNYTGTTAITFANDGGNASSHERHRYEPTGTTTAVACVVLGTDSGPCYRTFRDCLALNGNPLIDFAASEMTYVFGGGGNCVLFTSGASKKAVLVGVRIATSGSTVTVKGVNHAFSDCEIAGPVIFDATTQGCAYSGNTDQGVTDNWVATGAAGTPNLIIQQGDSSKYDLTDAATIAVDASLAKTYYVTLAGNRTIDLPTNARKNKRITFVVTQDGVGGRTLAFHAVFKHAWSNTGNTLGKISSITFEYNGTNWVQLHAQGPYV